MICTVITSYPILCLAFSHPPNLGLVHVLLQAFIEMLPPFEEQGVANKPEPWCKLQVAIVEHGLQFVGGNISSASNLVQVWLEVNICLDEENVVNCRYHATSVSHHICREILTYFHAPPIYHHWVPYSVSALRI